MLVGKVKTDPKRNVTLSMRESLVERVDMYRALYEQTYDDTIDRSELIERLLEAALNRDRDFKRYEREQARKEAEPAEEGEPAEEAEPRQEGAGAAGVTSPGWGQ